MKGYFTLMLRLGSIFLIIISTLPVRGDHVPNPTITASARAFAAGFVAGNVFDSSTAEYATASQGAVTAPFTTDPNNGTWIEFDFTTTVALNQFVMVTRNNAVDVIGSSRLIVSADPVFDSSDAIVPFSGTGVNAAGIIQNFPSVAGRYARWEVLSPVGTANLGARQIYFLNIPAGHVLLPAPVAINSATPFNASFAASFAVNGDAGDGPNHEYASAGTGASMFVDFDFGASRVISGHDFWNRVVDRVTTYNLVFADTADFSSPVATVSFTADLNGNRVNSGTFTPVTARYVRFQATGATGGVNTGMREIQFYTPAGQPPFISQHPQGGTRLVGDSFTFTVAAGGDVPRFYQWWHGTTAIDGATNTSLTLSNLLLTAAGDYHVVVSNGFGTATSDPGTLTVVDPALDITSDLRGWFQLDEGTFLVAGDSSGNGNHGTLQGFADDDSHWVPGRTGGGLRFNPLGSGINEVVAVPDTGHFDFSANPEFTIALWVRGSGAQEDGAGVVARGVGGGGEQYAVDIFAGSYRFFVRDAAGGAVVAHSPIRPNGTWQHVVAVYSRTLSRMKVFVNTAEVASGVAFTSGLLANSHEVSIGARKNAASVNYDLNLNAAVDDVRIYGRALTPRDVAALYAEAAPVGPTIVQHPLAAYVGVGDSTTLTVAVDGTVPLRYQWQKGGVAIAGATNASLTIAGAQLSDAGQYSVTAMNEQGSATSDEARVTVVPFLNLSAAPVQASSVFNASFAPQGAFDRLRLGTGPNTARWASAPIAGSAHWIYVDLGGDLAIRRVTADFDPACGASFSLRVRTEAQGPSANPDEWLSIATVTGYTQAGQGIDGADVMFDFMESLVLMPGNTSPTAVTTIDGTIQLARYLMLHVGQTAPGFNHVSVWELQVDAVSTAAQIQPLMLGGAGARISFAGIPRRDYEIQRSTSLSGPWDMLTTVAPAASGMAEYLDMTPPQPNAFYRVVGP